MYSLHYVLTMLLFCIKLISGVEKQKAFTTQMWWYQGM